MQRSFLQSAMIAAALGATIGIHRATPEPREDYSGETIPAEPLTRTQTTKLAASRIPHQGKREIARRLRQQAKIAARSA